MNSTADLQNLSTEDREHLLQAAGSENIRFEDGQMHLTKTGELIRAREIVAGRLPGDTAAARKAIRGLEHGF